MTQLVAIAWAVAWIGAALLAWAGIAKVRHPSATTESLALSGLPDQPWVARTLGVAEVALAAVVFATGQPLAAAALALAHVAFAAVSWHLLRTGQGSCGCFGEVEAPLSRIHVATNVVVAVAAGVATLGPAPAPGTGLELALLVGLLVVGAAVVRMLLVLVPALADGVERLRAT